LLNEKRTASLHRGATESNWEGNLETCCLNENGGGRRRPHPVNGVCLSPHPSPWQLQPAGASYTLDDMAGEHANDEVEKWDERVP